MNMNTLMAHTTFKTGGLLQYITTQGMRNRNLEQSHVNQTPYFDLLKFLQ